MSCQKIHVHDLHGFLRLYAKNARRKNAPMKASMNVPDDSPPIFIIGFGNHIVIHFSIPDKIFLQHFLARPEETDPGFKLVL
jgi:hypothetical protein